MKEKRRIEWIDILRGMAIIFVYLGHWNTSHLGPFAYSFHLKLFFMISGFFAIDCVEKYTFKQFFKKKFLTIMIPLFIWDIISIVIRYFDTNFILKDLLYIFYEPKMGQDNYWFLPALFGLSILYYILKKFLKKDLRILIVSYVLFMLFASEMGGYTGILYSEGPLYFLSKFKCTQIFNNWFDFNSIPSFLLWYSIGAISFKKICSFIDDKQKNYNLFHIIGIFSVLISTYLFLKSVSGIEFVQKYIVKNWILYGNYRIAVGIIIIISFIYISTFMYKLNILTYIGKNTMSLLGLEFIIRNILIFDVLPRFNFGMQNGYNTIYVIIFVIIQLFINVNITKIINKTFPVLNGQLEINKNN